MSEWKIFGCYFLVLILYFFDRNEAALFRSHPNWPKHIDEKCGESYSDRIIGGQDADLGQFPWMAQIFCTETMPIFDGNEKKFICGGTLISDQYVLTASHCTPPVGYKLDSVVLGEFDVRTNPDCDENICADPIQTILIEESIVPSPYNPNTHLNDIMLIKLATPAKFTAWVMPICLPTGVEEFTKSVESAGWGLTDSLNSSPTLKYVKLPIIHIDACRFPQLRIDENTQICAGTKTLNQDTCRGDSGGPLMSVANTEYGPRYFLVGIVSFGAYKCGETPAVYTNVTAFMPFILNSMREPSSL